MIDIQREGVVMPLYKGKSKPYRRMLRMLAISFVLFIYAGLSTGLLVLYGPFENIRRTVIGAVLTSRHPWYIEPFYSAETLAKYRPIAPDKMGKGTLNAQNFSEIHNDVIETVPIKTLKYSGYLMIVKDPKRIHVEVTRHIGSVGETVSEMVKRNNGVAGMNGGGFYDVKGKGTGGIPMGMTISRGTFVTGEKETLYPVIGITKNGALMVGKYTYEEVEKLEIQDAVSFGPELIREGQPTLKEIDDSWGIAPRSAIGQRKDGAILLLALSGRGNEGVGASLLDCVEVLLEHGAYTAANLDGGYSTELYYKGDFLVTPSNPLGERYVATSFVVDSTASITTTTEQATDEGAERE